jgi:hypothetical protein
VLLLLRASLSDLLGASRRRLRQVRSALIEQIAVGRHLWANARSSRHLVEPHKEPGNEGCLDTPGF